MRVLIRVLGFRFRVLKGDMGVLLGLYGGFGAAWGFRLYLGPQYRHPSTLILIKMALTQVPLILVKGFRVEGGVSI